MSTNTVLLTVVEGSHYGGVTVDKTVTVVLPSTQVFLTRKDFLSVFSYKFLIIYFYQQKRTPRSTGWSTSVFLVEGVSQPRNLSDRVTIV